MVTVWPLASSVVVLALAAALRPPWRQRLPAIPARARHAEPRSASAAIGRMLVPARWSLSPLRHSQIGLAVPAMLVGMALWPPATPAFALGGWAVPLAGHRRRIRSEQSRLRRELPDVIDLFALAFGTGMNLRLGVEAVATANRSLVTRALDDALSTADRGVRLHLAIGDQLDHLGDPARPLARVLTDDAASPAERRAQLEVVGIDARLERRRLAEAEARRLPVRLLFPLVICVLPAFGLLTVVPVVAGSLRSLSS